LSHPLTAPDAGVAPSRPDAASVTAPTPPTWPAATRLEQRRGAAPRPPGPSLAPALLRAVRLRPLRPQPERMVVRATTLVPHRSAVVTAADA